MKKQIATIVFYAILACLLVAAGWYVWIVAVALWRAPIIGAVAMGIGGAVIALFSWAMKNMQ